MKKYGDFSGFILWLLTVMVVAVIAASFSPAFNAEWYKQLSKPAWTPPDSLFGPVWTALYILMTISAWRVWRDGGWEKHSKALALFIAQLALNGAWMGIFFGYHLIGWALIEIIVLTLLIIVVLYHFYIVDRWAAFFLIPYLVWVGYATALTFSIWTLNG